MKDLKLTLRGRLTFVYGGLFLLIGAVLLIVNYILVSGSLPEVGNYARTATAALGPAMRLAAPTEGTPIAPARTVPADEALQVVSGSLTDYRSSTLSQLVLTSVLALVIAAALAVALGWVVSGRALHPIHAITSTARRLGARNLDRRINLDGPPDELKELADTFDGMLDRLAVSFDSQKRFVANASHELRTPLAVQRTLIEVALADPDATPEVRKLGQQLLYTNERSERMIEGLLVLARSDRGLTSRTPVRLDEVAEHVARSVQARANEKNVTVSVNAVPRTVAGDPVLLERLLTNLVDNAITYNHEGGSVVVEVGSDPALVVRNTGVPVDPGAVPQLFEPFRRLTERTGDSRNAGLGLSIVRSVVQAHGGTVHAEAGEQGGLVVAVRLPG
ncbi:sensor histidine kinase [Amycolatopsis sp. CA-230715]|uniref:sensor histidine kinase n=1 Tax=Amycolatopsis sp. CA-230715 TaxID=2745196 RepID=UPI001C024A7B|nr:ATP-binding protein [Amycolatopsis sp. CA-230715]QWF81708.1 Adaptive-response sensory-kinase SasA [Amycolatopsis sp. CA-230715]